MNLLIVIPSYNDPLLAWKLGKKVLSEEGIVKVLIVDESDDTSCIEYIKKLKDGKIEIIHRQRIGKWAMWPLAFDKIDGYDGIIQLDADIGLSSLKPIVDKFGRYDVISCYMHYREPKNRFGKVVSRIYEGIQRSLEEHHTLILAGPVIGLSKRAVEVFRDRKILHVNVPAEDHAICLAGRTLNLRCTSVDCGIFINLPSSLHDWIKFRSRHRATVIKESAKYIGNLTDKRAESFSRTFHFTIFKELLKSIFRVLKSDPFLILTFILSACISSFLPFENSIMWSRLTSEKAVEP